MVRQIKRCVRPGNSLFLLLYMKVAMAPIMQRRSARLSFFVVAGPYGPAMLVCFRHLAMAVGIALFCSGQSFAAHGVSIDGVLKYPSGFERFSYTSASAKKGGALILHSLGGFDKMNPFTLKGQAPDGLDTMVFETLGVPSLDEPFVEYGLIAKDIVLAPDQLSVTFTLDERARFSDGSPVTTEDVAFSLKTMKSDMAHPFYHSYFQDITRAEIVSPLQIRLHFAQKNRELHLVACQLPVLSKKFFQDHPFGAAKSALVAPVGSGPYVVDTFKAGKFITYKRNPDYWAANHPTRKGMFNYDAVTYKYFKDQIVSLEAFKAHEFDFMYINIAKQWARDLDGGRFDRGEIVKELLPHKNNAGMQGFVMNLRRPLFQDRMVRKALSLAFDFHWTNQALFFNQYTRCNSFFSNSPLAATGKPHGLELDYLKPFEKVLPPEVFTTPLTPFSTASPSSLRENLRQAAQLLRQAGWMVEDGVLTKGGKPFRFDILLASPSFERVMASYANNLKRLGIQVDYRVIDPALYVDRLRRFDFDMVVNVFGQSQSPGNEQRGYWHSSVAGKQGSRNVIGLQDPVVDAMVDRIVYAKTRKELTAACRALDRVLWYGYYVVPNWYIAGHRVAFWDRFGRPETLPLYYNPEQLLMTWWIQKVKDGKQQ